MRDKNYILSFDRNAWRYVLSYRLVGVTGPVNRFIQGSTDSEPSNWYADYWTTLSFTKTYVCSQFVLVCEPRGP
jgi:hypothetical protein